MNFQVNTYNPSDVYLTIGGGYNCVGWNDITIKRSVQAFRNIKGIRGKNTRVRDSDTSAEISISLMQTSPTHDVLSQIHQLDLEQGTGRIELTLADKSGNSLVSSTEAYITGFPIKSYKDGIEFLQWVIFCQSTDDYVVGGNSRPDTSLINQALELFS